jgi:hypothetical protein
MATYLQGVTDFIPDYQPFQPDYNFYANALQTKQTQYDTNWKQLNNLYGQLYGANLTHDSNIKKKDELLKQIDFNLKRVSGLDLSLEQNANQAMQVFRPFYEDKYLMKDMAWTKNWTSTYNSAEGLRTSEDEKQRKTWWGKGIKGLELRKQMFKDATLEQTLGFRNAKYTPFVNAVQDYRDLAKKLNISRTEKVPDKSGLYFVKRKNGELILPALQNIFAAEYANRPDIQDMYREEAFVERMSYAYQNAEKFNGNKDEAEKEYINGKLEFIKQYASDRYRKSEDAISNTQSLQGKLERDVKEGNLKPQQNNYGKSLAELFEVDKAINDNAKQLNNQVNDGQATATIKGYEDKGVDDLEIARMKVDAGYATMRAQKDIMAAAGSYANSNASIEYSVNQVGLTNLKHQYRNSEIDRIAANKARAARDKDMLDKGYWHRDIKTGKIIAEPQANGFNLVNLESGDGGQSTAAEYSFEQLQEIAKDNLIKNNAAEGTEHLMKTIQNGVATNSFSAVELATLVQTFNPSNATAQKILKEGSKNYMNDIKTVWNSIWSEYTNNPTSFIKDVAGNGKIHNTNKVMQHWVSLHSADDLAEKYLNDQSIVKLEQFSRQDKALLSIENDNYKRIKNQITNSLETIVQKTVQANPGKNITYDQDRVNEAVDRLMYRYTLDNNGHQKEFDEDAAAIDKEISQILGFTPNKITNAPTDVSWQHIVFPLTNVPRMFNDNRSNIKSQASWVKDVFDLSYEDLLTKTPKDGGLQPFFTQITRGGDASSTDRFGIAAQTGTILVMPGVRQDPGNVATQNFIDIVNAVNWNQDQTKYRVSIDGNVKPTEEDLENPGITPKEALSMIRDLNQRLNTDKKLKPFSISTSHVAMENAGLSSMTIRIPREIAEKMIKSITKDDATGMDVNKKIDKIVQSGLTFIAPNHVWESNPLYTRQFASPTEVVLRNGPINYEDPQGMGYYSIQKTPGTSDYIGAAVYYEMLSDGNKGKLDATFNLDSKAGHEIDNRERLFYEAFNKVKLANFDMFRRIVKAGNAEHIKNAEKNFGLNASNPMWKY